jgi:integrase
MAGSAFIVTRNTEKSGRRHVVRYRRGGRGFPIVHGGSFRTLKEAKARRDLIAVELAAGRSPRDTLDVAVQSSTSRRTLREVADAYRASRIDIAPKTAASLDAHMKAILPMFGSRDPATITPADVQSWIASLNLKPSSVRRYIATFRQLLDFAGVKPNPARDDLVRLPRVYTEEPSPPTAAQFLAILDNSPQRWRLLLITLEQTAMRIGEASNLCWGDVDVAESRFRLRATETKSRRARWVQVPPWLMKLIAETCALEDRVSDRKVFMGLTADVAKNVVARACRSAGIALYSPHDLRHRRLSLWHGHGVPAKELAQRAGHARASMTLDVYSHVMSLDEVSPESLSALLVVSG